MSVKFKQSNSPYQIGEVATFPDDIEAGLVDRGIAEPYQTEPKPEPKPKRMARRA